MPVDIPGPSGLQQHQEQQEQHQQEQQEQQEHEERLLPTSVSVAMPMPMSMSMPLALRRQSVKTITRQRNTLKGPMRAARLFLLSIILPCILIAVPLYMRYHVYGDQLYPVAMSDMRLLDGRVSTTWCQRQLVKVNATFNAFLLAEQPQTKAEPVHLTMTRDLWLEDDTKEYWAFYLLKGSSITVSTCVRGPGASLIVIRGHKHLHDCAYIGDDSSEEQDELDRLAEQQQEQAQQAQQAQQGGQWPLRNSSEARSNEPRAMRRARPGVSFHSAALPLDSQERLGHAESSDADEDAGHVLGHLLGKVAEARIKAAPEVPPQPRQRGTIASSPETDKIKNPKTGDSYPDPTEMRKQAPVNQTKESESSQKQRTEKIRQNHNKVGDGNKTKTTKSTSDTSQQNSTDDILVSTGTKNPSSSEVFEDVLKKLQQLGPRGKSVLRRLNEKLGGKTPGEGGAAQKDDGLDALRAMIRDLLREDDDQPRTRHQKGRARKQKQRGEVSEDSHNRERRHITLSSPGWAESLSAHDEDADAALESMEADGIADHHVTLNETTAGDFSKSEFWSSFSSSEEALLNCVGLILNLPLTPHHRCEQRHDAHVLSDASLVNTLTYKVPRNGYYFFVFSSENEVQANYIHTHFELEKVVYNISNPLDACHNSTEQCALALDFFSSEKVVLEVPASTNDSLWNHEFIVVSTCEPRTALYLCCVIAVPLLIVIFAFQ